MANIIRKNDPTPATSPALSDWNPFRTMRELMGWDPFREMSPYVGRAERLEFVPAFEVRETRDAFVFRADLPGVKDSDIDVQLIGNRLSIGGRREQDHEEKGDTYYTYERSYGSFTRAFTLPDGIDAEHIKSELKEGVLTLVVPKTPEAQPKKIHVQASSSGRKS